MSDIRLRMAGGMTPQPTRMPVAQNAFEIASRKITYGALSGTSPTGVWCSVFPNVSVQ